MPTVSAVMPKPLVDALDLAAGREGKSRSAAIVAACERWCEVRETWPTPQQARSGPARDRYVEVADEGFHFHRMPFMDLRDGMLFRLFESDGTVVDGPLVAISDAFEDHGAGVVACRRWRYFAADGQGEVRDG